MNNEPILITNISTSYFSIARHTGVIKIDGVVYAYCPERDILVKEDWLKIYKRLSWEDFIDAVKSGVKPTLPKSAKYVLPQNAKPNKKEIEQTTKSLFDL